MSGEDLLNAVFEGNFEEVVRLVDEEHVGVDSIGVSFPFLKKKSQ